MTWLSRAALGDQKAPAPRLAHLGLGSFFRAHPCWYTDRAPDGPQWSFAAFTGRDSARLASDLAGQDGLYTLIERGPDADAARIVRCLALARSARDHDAWLSVLADPDLAAVTITVTEAGYLRGAGYLTALTARFGNTRLADRLDRVAADGSQKIPIRVLPVLRAERAAGRLPRGATRILAAWACHLRGLGAPVRDAAASEVVPLAAGPLARAIPALLRWLDPETGADKDVCALVTSQCAELAGLKCRGKGRARLR